MKFSCKRHIYIPSSFYTNGGHLRCTFRKLFLYTCRTGKKVTIEEGDDRSRKGEENDFMFDKESAGSIEVFTAVCDVT